MPTDYETLVPQGVAGELIAAAERQSAALRLADTMPMPEGAQSIPVVTVEPQAEWVDPRYGGRKPATTIEWSASRLEAEELACVLAIPAAYIDDSGFPVWPAVRARLATAFAKRIDSTLLFGLAPVPASFPAGGVAAAAGAALSGTDALDAIDKGLAALEAQGLIPDGVASSAAIGSALRAEYRTIGSLPSEAPTASVYGVDVAIPAYWDATKGDAIVGDWTKLVIGIRQDIRFELSDSAVAAAAAGLGY